MTFEQINDATGFANGDYFETAEQVREYFRWAAAEFEIDAEEADEMAETVISNGWHFVPDLRLYRVTLRELSEANVPLDGSFGIDEAERAELLDDPNILRIAATYGNDVLQEIAVECFQASSASGFEATWTPCVDWQGGYHRPMSPGPHSFRNHQRDIERRIEGLIREENRIPDEQPA